jgi:hypothetical protein
LVIQDKNSLPAVEVCRIQDGGVLTVFNNAGKPVATMAAFAGCGSISLYDNKLHLLVSMDASPLGGRIAIKDRSGQTLWSAP